MSGIISKSHLMSITIIFSAALLMMGLNLYRALTASAMQLQRKYEEAIVSQTGNTFKDLINKQSVTFPMVYTSIFSNDVLLNYINFEYLNEPNRNAVPIEEAQYILLTNAVKLDMRKLETTIT